MSGKRQASYTIDPHTLEEKDKDQNPQSDPLPSQPQKQQRKIFKIKRPGENGSSQQKQTKVTFRLNQSQQIKPSGEQTNQPESNENTKEKTIQNPFANFFKADKDVFNGIGIFSNSTSMNLFTSNKGTEESAKTQANPTKAPNIFAANSSASTVNTNSKNLFNNGSSILKGTNASLFQLNNLSEPQQNTTSIPTVNTTANNDDDGSGDSAQLQQAQNLESDPSKSTKTFNYDDSCPVLLTLKASKFKKSGSELIENVQLVLQKQKQTNIKYISVRLPVTKKNIFSGILVQKKSEVKNINGKKQNVEVSAFTKEKEGFAKVLLKFQFDKEEDGEKLFERLQELLSVKEAVPAKEDGSDKKE